MGSNPTLSVSVTRAAATLAVAACLSAALAATEAGMVAGTNGAPTVARAGKTDPLRRADPVFVDDLIETDSTAKAKILLADDSVLSIGPTSRIRLSELTLNTQRSAVLTVLTGRFKLAIAKFLGGPSQFQVVTPTAIIGVRGTVLWGDTALDTVCALEGTIEVKPLTGQSPAALLGAGECVSQMGAGKTVRQTPSPEELARYLREVTLD